MTLIATTPRAPRYALQTRVVYRREGDEAWQEGRAVNVSRSGVLFQPHGMSPPRAAVIEFVLELPSVSPHGHARVACRGRVARCSSGPVLPAVAATIDSYRFLDPTAPTP